MEYRIFSLGSNDGLAEKIAKKLGTSLGRIKCETFSDGEQRVQFEENLRSKHIYLVQSTNPPADNWARLFLAIDAARGASAREITAVIPYFGYGRQDRKDKDGQGDNNDDKGHPRRGVSLVGAQQGKADEEDAL